MSLLKSIQQTFVLAIVLVALLGYQFMSAQTWSAPSAAAPSGNAAAPINVSATYQDKAGDLGAVRMRSGSYCSADGANCNFSVGGSWRDVAITSPSPTLDFRDTDQRSTWLHMNSNILYVLADRNSDGNWSTDHTGAWPMEMYIGDTAAQDAVTFSNQVRANQFCDRAGGNCVSPGAMGGGGGLGYNQTWQVVNRSAWVWYQNDTPQPIMVFHKNIVDGTVIEIGTTQTNGVVMNFQDFDSDLDNGSTIVVPPYHYYRFHTATENSGNGHRLVRELR